MAEDVEGLIAELRVAEAHLIANTPPDLRPDAFAEPPYTLYGQAADALAGMTARIAELEAGLEPFAEYAAQIEQLVPDDFVSRDGRPRKIVVGDFRRAHALLNRDRDHG